MQCSKKSRKKFKNLNFIVQNMGSKGSKNKKISYMIKSIIYLTKKLFYGYIWDIPSNNYKKNKIIEKKY